MDARHRADPRSDAELVRAVLAGDRGAFAAVYDRYADRLHDFCWSLLRDRDEAADATQDAFLVAAERLGQLRDPERLRPWLYAVARSQALRRARARQRVAPEEDMIDRPDTAAGPELAAERADLRELVWNAAAGLSERDRAVLDLHLRHGLEGAELGEAIGVSASHTYVLLSRLRDQVERSLGALLVARLGRRDCPDLARLLVGWDGRFSPLVRKRVARHVDGCDRCGERRRALASPLALLAAVPPLPAPTWLRGQVLERLQLTASPGGPQPPQAGPPGDGPQPPQAEPPGGGQEPPQAPAEPPGDGPQDGAPAAARGGRAGRAALLAAALVLGVAGGVALGWERQPAASDPGAVTGQAAAGAVTSAAVGAASTTAASTSTATSSSSTTATTAPAPASLALAPAAVDLGAGRNAAAVTLRNAGGSPLSWTAATSAPWLRVAPAAGRLDGGAEARLTVTADRDDLPEGPAEGAVEVRWDGPAGRIAVDLEVERPPRIDGLSASPDPIRVQPCQPNTALVQAQVSDESPLASVVLEWGGTQVPMTQRAGTWYGRVGPVDEPQAVAWRVTASDVRGNQASASGPAVQALACP
jgi:RNA polymerase sigma factor (sigma-70 family)